MIVSAEVAAACATRERDARAWGDPDAPAAHQFLIAMGANAYDLADEVIERVTGNRPAESTAHKMRYEQIKAATPPYYPEPPRPSDSAYDHAWWSTSVGMWFV